MNMLPLAFGLIAIVATTGYFAAQPLFQQFPAKLYQVLITRTSSGLGGSVNLTGRIRNTGVTFVTMLEKSRLETVPPIHSYLIIKAGSETTYAVVFWKSYENGTEYVSFASLLVLVSNLQNAATFAYSSEAANDFIVGVG